MNMVNTALASGHWMEQVRAHTWGFPPQWADQITRFGAGRAGGEARVPSKTPRGRVCWEAVIHRPGQRE